MTKKVEFFASNIQKSIALYRYPKNSYDLLQAWDASDELILQELPESLVGLKILVINDSFGALSFGLAQEDCVFYNDSFLHTKGAQENFPHNKLVYNDLFKIQGEFDLVLLKMPKSLSYLEDILCRLTNLMKPNSQLLCGVMIKHINTSMFDLINKYIGETSTSLAKKKARVIKANFTFEKVKKDLAHKLFVPEVNEHFKNYSNVFSYKKLDIGTRYFLNYLPRNLSGKILDLGCGNGILGIEAKKRNPDASIIFVDDSFMAIESASENYRQIIGEDDQIKFLWQNCYENENNEKVDYILCNPPFHQQNTVTKEVAYQMFRDSFKALNTNGILRVVANRHLDYGVKIKKIFGHVNLVHQNNKFVILEAKKS